MATILASNLCGVEGTSSDLPRWQNELKTAFRDGRKLLDFLQLPHSLLSDDAAQEFPLFVPHGYARRMRIGDPDDPLLRQVLATDLEMQNRSAGLNDPVGDLVAERVPGLLHKYRGRALVITNGTCAVHCRYCFRRHFPYDSIQPGSETWMRWLDYVRSEPSIDEVILSGGDPLTLSDVQLSRLVAEVNALPQIQRIRLHTRFPVVIPQRICNELIAWVSASRATVYCVLHFNHANEIDGSVRSALARLHAAGAVLLNQAVLLNGINDSVAAQLALCRGLIDARVIPYYLHQLDRVAGGLHFEVAESRGHEIIAALQSHLPGYAVPRYVREVAGQPSKTAL